MTYKSKELAENYIEKIALDYIREIQGKQQLDVCKQYDKTPDQILSDTNLKEGNYLIKSVDKIYLFEKKNQILPGILWNTTNLTINKIGEFSIMPIFIDIDLNEFSIKNPIKQIKYIPENSPKNLYYLDELKAFFNSEKFHFNSPI